MFDLGFITSLFGSANTHAQVALTTSGDWLPAAGWYIGIASMLAIAAVLVVFFLKMIGLGIKLGVAAAVFALFAVLAFGYEAKGENNIIPKLNAANQRITNDEARADSFRADAAAGQAKAVAQTKARKVALIAAEKSNLEKLNAQPIAVTAMPLPRVVGVYVNESIVAATTDSAFGPGSSDAARAAATAGATVTVGDFEAWAANAAIEHARLAAQVNGLLDIHEALVKAGAQADADHPADAKPPPKP